MRYGLSTGTRPKPRLVLTQHLGASGDLAYRRAALARSLLPRTATAQPGRLLLLCVSLRRPHESERGARTSFSGVITPIDWISRERWSQGNSTDNLDSSSFFRRCRADFRDNSGKCDNSMPYAQRRAVREGSCGAIVSNGMGRTLRTFRLRAGLTQQLLAELAGVSVAGVRDLEQGRVRRPRPANLRRLGSALGLSRSEFDSLLIPAAHVTAGVRIEILGPLQVVVDNAVTAVMSQSQRVLLGFLALSPNSPVRQDALVDELWGSRPPPGVLGSLQSRVSRLRQKLRSESGTVAVAGTASGYQLAVQEQQHDLLLFRRLVTRARRSRQVGEWPEAATALSEALALWRGDPVADVPALRSRPDVIELSWEWRGAVTEFAAITNELGCSEHALPYLRRAAATDALHERTHSALMLALAGSGQQAAALRLFDQFRRRLADEVGADPGAELTSAYERVLHREVRCSESRPLRRGHEIND